MKRESVVGVVFLAVLFILTLTGIWWIWWINTPSQVAPTSTSQLAVIKVSTSTPPPTTNLATPVDPTVEALAESFLETAGLSGSCRQTPPPQNQAYIDCLENWKMMRWPKPTNLDGLAGNSFEVAEGKTLTLSYEGKSYNMTLEEGIQMVNMTIALYRPEAPIMVLAYISGHSYDSKNIYMIQPIEPFQATGLGE